MTAGAIVPDDVQAHADERRAELCRLLGVAACESCRRAPGDVPVIVGTVLFAVCAECAAVAPC